MANPLDDHGQREALADHLRGGGTMTTAAEQLFGFSRVHLQRCLAKLADTLGAEGLADYKAVLDRARAGNVPLIPSAGTFRPNAARREPPLGAREVVVPEVMGAPPRKRTTGIQPIDSTELVDKDELLLILAKDARDSTSDGHNGSVKILSALLLGPDLIHVRRLAEAMAPGDKPHRVLVIRVPAKADAG